MTGTKVALGVVGAVVGVALLAVGYRVARSHGDQIEQGDQTRKPKAGAEHA